MGLKLAVGRSNPEETRQIAKAAFPKGNVYLWIGDELGELYADHLFIGLYPVRGQPTISPGRLALITILQFMEGLTDRQAAEAVRGRIDWKYALGLELTDPGFDFSVLSEFRERLSAGQQEQTLLNVLLDELKQRGWLKARSKQRTDSTHVLASVRQLNRLVMMGETMRQALNELAEVDPDWLKSIAPSEWFTHYGQRLDGLRLPKEREKREALLEVIGADGIYLLSTLWETPEKKELWQLPGVKILQQIWIQQYWMEYAEGEGKYLVHSRADDNQPPGDKRIHSPYDVECRYCTKRSTEWVGYKVHLTETCEADTVHLITHVETSSAVEQDISVTERIHAAPEAKGIAPQRTFVGYGIHGCRVAGQCQRGLWDCDLWTSPERCTLASQQWRWLRISEFPDQLAGTICDLSTRSSVKLLVESNQSILSTGHSSQVSKRRLLRLSNAIQMNSLETGHPTSIITPTSPI